MNSSMLLIIPTSEVSYRLGTLSPPVKVGWEARDPYTMGLIQPWSWGGMQKFSSCYVCEFSGSAAFDASCGPTPFTSAGTFNLDFFANDFNEEAVFNRTILIHPDRFTGIAINIGADNIARISAVGPVDTSEMWVYLRHFYRPAGKQLDEEPDPDRLSRATTR